MRGFIKQRSEGSYSLVVYLGEDPVTGKKRQKWETYKGPKKGAETRLTHILNEINVGAYAEPGKLRVDEYLRRWLADYAKTNVSGKTYERYAQIVEKHLAPALGSVPLFKLKPLQIQGYYSHALQNGRLLQKGRKEPCPGLSARTVLHHHRVLHDALALAVEWQLLARNPADAVRPPKPEAVEMRALNEAESAWLLEVAKGTRLFAPLLFAVTTGVRRGELVGLRWGDIVDGKAAIRRSVEQTKEGGIRFKPPKGRKGVPSNCCI
jgi:integrase